MINLLCLHRWLFVSFARRSLDVSIRFIPCFGQRTQSGRHENNVHRTAHKALLTVYNSTETITIAVCNKIRNTSRQDGTKLNFSTRRSTTTLYQGCNKFMKKFLHYFQETPSRDKPRFHWLANRLNVTFLDVVCTIIMKLFRKRYKFWRVSLGSLYDENGWFSLADVQYLSIIKDYVSCQWKELG